MYDPVRLGHLRSCKRNGKKVKRRRSRSLEDSTRACGVFALGFNRSARQGHDDDVAVVVAGIECVALPEEQPVSRFN